VPSVDFAEPGDVSFYASSKLGMPARKQEEQALPLKKIRKGRKRKTIHKAKCLKLSALFFRIFPPQLSNAE